MKRKRQSRACQRENKRVKQDDVQRERPTQPLLRTYYPEVVTLRQYLVSRLVSSSKRTRRRLQQYGRDETQADGRVSDLLDTTIIGAFERVRLPVDDLQTIEHKITLFSQHVASCGASVTLTPGKFKQAQVRFAAAESCSPRLALHQLTETESLQIVDFVVWLLFRRNLNQPRVDHILCQGLQRYLPSGTDESAAVSSIPGVWSINDNEHAGALRKHPWNVLPDLLGSKAERIISDLFLDCGVFVPIAGSSNMAQICGVPMHRLSTLSKKHPPDLNLIAAATDEPEQRGTPPITKNAARGLSEIRFVRHRMLYTRPTITSEGRVRLGMSPIHVLNRCRDSEDNLQTLHVMKHIFPRQFGLHNVFESAVDHKDTAHAFKDYMLREREIDEHGRRAGRKRAKGRAKSSRESTPLPRRLRGATFKHAQSIRKRHVRCPYAALFNYYCASSNIQDPGSSPSSTRQATPVSQVTAFCKAVIRRVFPAALWGQGEVGLHNAGIIDDMIEAFILLRRYESLSLHSVMQGMKLKDIAWLAPPNHVSGDKLSRTDLEKRSQVMAELVYYIFDSFLIPLIRAHFYVTESGAFRNQLFYFRHDVWQQMSKPALNMLKATMLEECSPSEMKQTFQKRALGVSHVRLLPKESGMRPIINLRRRVQMTKHGPVVLGRSINNILTPAFSVLNYEKACGQKRLGSALFSVDDMLPRLQSFRRTLTANGLTGRPLYFAKVDVQACFDSIPQKRLMELVHTIVTADRYNIAKYSRAKLLGSDRQGKAGFGTIPSWKFLTTAIDGEASWNLAEETMQDVKSGRRRSIFVDGGIQGKIHRRAVLALLTEHVEQNLIKVGARVYRQKQGIPQGSIVSSLLCSYFYAELERHVLSFVTANNSILFRLIDDFLVISADKAVAEKFMQVMHAGVPEFGVKVKAEKSRANFDLLVDGKNITRMNEICDFPYCGNSINTSTLNLSKDQERRRTNNISDSITVEYTKVPGQTFYRKTLNAVKLQLQAMLLSTSFNSVSTVLGNLFNAFVDVAQKAHHYEKSLPSAKQPHDKLFIKTVNDITKLARALMHRRRLQNSSVIEYECSVSNAQARWLACTAFSQVFLRRQTKHAKLLSWLKTQLASPALRREERMLSAIVG
jgi:telomerase reverse transcriptase